MVTHNMEQALQVGNCTIMMHEDQIILDLKRKQCDDMTIPKLTDYFHEVKGEVLENDRMLLS